MEYVATIAFCDSVEQTTVMDGRPSLRERNRARTREEIEVAAFDLFRERGFDAVTVEQIAAVAGVSHRTFYRYFPTKEDVVFGEHEAAVARLRAALAEADPAEPPLRRVRRALIAVQQPGRRPELEVARARLVAESAAVRARNSQLAEDFENMVAEALAPGSGSDDAARARAVIVAAALFGALRGARRAIAEADPGSRLSPQRAVELALDVAEFGGVGLLAATEE